MTCFELSKVNVLQTKLVLIKAEQGNKESEEEYKVKQYNKNDFKQSEKEEQMALCQGVTQSIRQGREGVLHGDSLLICLLPLLLPSPRHPSPPPHKNQKALSRTRGAN